MFFPAQYVICEVISSHAASEFLVSLKINRFRSLPGFCELIMIPLLS